MLGRLIANRYEVRRLIGKGGMGAVYEAWQGDLGRRVAVKFLVDTGMPMAMRQRFHREGALARRVVDEHVAQLYDVGTTDDGHEYLVMEYVEGDDLGTLIAREGPFSVERAVAIARAMLLGLRAIHGKDILHRDVKPTNVLVARGEGGADIIKIADFGLARGAGDATLTATGHVVGTTAFMAPEVFRGDAIDHRADLYAVGITLYQMLTGALPFLGATAEIGAKHVYEPPPPITRARPDVPAHVARAIETALAKSPADRFRDAQAFIDALDGKVPALDPITYSPPTVASRPVRRPQPRRWPWLLALVGVAGGAAIGAVLARRNQPAPVAIVPPDHAAAVAADAAVIVAPDAAVIVAAQVVPVDAAVALPDAATAAHVKPAHHPAVATCQCLPSDGEQIALCPAQGRSLCRCNDARGRPLCERELVPCRLEDRAEVEQAGWDFDELCTIDNLIRCPDLTWARFARPGTAGAACSGYSTAVLGKLWADGGKSGVKIDGYLDCDACPGANTRTYRGVPGARCSGFHWRTGAPVEGTLQHCE